MIHIIYGAVITLILTLQHLERRDLYNRIMSKNYGEYKSKEPKYHKSAHQRLIERWHKRGDEA